MVATEMLFSFLSLSFLPLKAHFPHSASLGREMGTRKRSFQIREEERRAGEARLDKYKEQDGLIHSFCKVLYECSKSLLNFQILRQAKSRGFSPILGPGQKASINNTRRYLLGSGGTERDKLHHLNWKLSQTLRRSHQKLRKHLILPPLSELLPAQGFLLGAAEDAGPIQETDYYY